VKAIRILLTNIDESFKGVFRNFSLSLASISCIAITLILVGFSIILSYNVNNFTKEIEGDLNIVVFLKRKATTDQIAFVEEKINMLSNIKEVTFNSRENVKASMQKESDVFNSVLSEYTEETNPLQDTFLVKVENINKIGETADELKKIENVDVVKYGEGSVEELVKIFNLVKKATYIIVIGLIIVTCFLISNTIKITIQSRRREIEIRRLVGASNMFIKQPFFFEGIIIGFIGSILPIAACCYGYAYLYDKMGGKVFTNIIKLVKPSELLYTIVFALMIIGVLVGAFGSYRAVRKYLKV
jgi:cell division transport system permease protein